MRIALYQMICTLSDRLANLANIGKAVSAPVVQPAQMGKTRTRSLAHAG